MGESFFQDRLDADPSDAAARLLLAEWLAERGDGRARGYEWAGARAKHPVDAAAHRGYDVPGWSWWVWYTEDRAANLPAELWEAVYGPRDATRAGHNRWKSANFTRREADDALAAALATT